MKAMKLLSGFIYTHMYQISMALHTEWPNSEHLITKCFLEMYDFCRCGHEGFDWRGGGLGTWDSPT